MEDNTDRSPLFGESKITQVIRSALSAVGGTPSDECLLAAQSEITSLFLIVLHEARWWKQQYESAVRALQPEVDRLKRGDFTSNEFQNLCHNAHERPGCSISFFRDGCGVFQLRLFGEEMLRATLAKELRYALGKVANSDGTDSLAEAMARELTLVVRARAGDQEFSPGCLEAEDASVGSGDTR